MPRTHEHIQQAQHNQELLKSLDIDNFPFLDWVATIAFYAALHYVEAWFASQGKGMHYTAHQERNRAISQVDEFRPVIWPNYRALQDCSHLARYKCTHPSKKAIQFVILPNLDTLEQEIRRLLA